MRHTGLVLSGGGVRGVAHIGAIKALEEFNIRPTHIAGTSAGAIIGALYAMGLSSSEMLEFFKKLPIFSLKRYAYKKPGFIDSDKFYKEFRRYLSDDNFNTLEKKLLVTATDVLTGDLKIFHEGELIKLVLASASFPGVFTPIAIDNSYYIDGGVLNDFPVDVIEPYCDQIIGVYVNPFEKTTIDTIKNSYRVLERAFHIKSTKESAPKFNRCNLLILPKELKEVGTFAFRDTDKVFNLGYCTAKRVLESQAGKKFIAAYMRP